MRKFIIEIVTWLLFEIVLNIAGLDDLGNYSEFVFAQKNTNLFPTYVVSMTI
ncbi:hypothetical protein [Chamaesiphon polymorphus]|uniref:hypothetical protein n=1 Tax=Chamaesiphon polymorphus TaxID=2107691 RepID=UPI0015E65A35|nr:hypothetical protein [Chamaesiphon polymorphus]